MVNVDERNAELIVASYSKTKPGFWVMNGWLRRVAGDTPDKDLGIVIESGLAASQTGVEAPGRDSNPAKPLLTMLGLRSYSAYMKGTRSVGVVSDGEAIAVEPSRNEGGGGFTPLPDRVERLHRPSASELGEAVREALNRAL